MYCVFFALPSLRRIESVGDTGAWSTMVHPSFGIGTLNPHIESLVLNRSALNPSEINAITKAFPNSEVVFDSGLNSSPI